MLYIDRNITNFNFTKQIHLHNFTSHTTLKISMWKIIKLSQISLVQSHKKNSDTSVKNTS